MQNNLLENKQFGSYFQHLKIDEGDWTETLPWGKTFWEDVHQCNLRFSNRYTKDCATDLNLSGLQKKQSPFVASTIHGVYALSKAFQMFWTSIATYHLLRSVSMGICQKSTINLSLNWIVLRLLLMEERYSVLKIEMQQFLWLSLTSSMVPKALLD